MKLSKHLSPFLILSILELSGRLLHLQEITWITKPLLIPALMLYFINSTPKTPLNSYILAALFFSFLGDTLLMLVPRSEYFFMAGLASFLLAHLIYIIVNMSAITEGERGFKPQWQDLIFVIYGLAIFSLINNDLGSMYIPVVIYTVVICLMAITARKRWKKTDDQSFKLVMAGAILFVISDSILAIDKFYKPFEASGFLIMLSYLAAQFLLVQGFIVFIQKIRPEAGS